MRDPRRRELVGTAVFIAVAIVLVGLGLAIVGGTGGDDEKAAAGKGSGGDPSLTGATGGRSSKVRDSDAEGLQGAGFDSRSALAPQGISGRVVDKVTGEPVTAFDFRLLRTDTESGATEKVLHQPVRNDDGRFAVSPETPGLYTIAVRSADHLEAKLAGLEVTERSAPRDLVISLDPGRCAAGRVCARVSGAGVERALVVSVADATRNLRELERLWLEEYEEACPHAWSEKDGTFRLAGLPPEQATLYAFHPDYATGEAQVRHEQTDVGDVPLDPGFRMFGKVVDDGGDPCPGVAIRVDAARVLPVLTGPDGSYRSMPMEAGPYCATAELWTEAQPGPVRFSTETKGFEIVDRDVRVDFGPSGDHVTWRGVLYEGEEAVAGGRIHVWTDSSFKWRDPRFVFRRAIRCDEEGRFCLRKLVPGRYVVKVSLPGHYPAVDYGRIFFESGGEKEKDIHLSGSRITGNVVFEGSREPPEGFRGHVRATTLFPAIANADVPVSGDGTFEARAVPPGTFRLKAYTDANVASESVSVGVGVAETVSGVRLVIPRTGRLEIALIGFERSELSGAELVLQQDVAGDQQSGPVEIAADGSARGAFDLAAGEWQVLVRLRGGKLIRRSAAVLSDQASTLVIHADDLDLSKREFSVEGRIRRAGEAEFRHAQIMLIGKEDAGTGGSSGRRDLPVDPQGRFRVDGVAPGLYTVTVAFVGHQWRLPDLVVLSDSTDPVVYEGLIPGGSVRGTIGAPAGPDGFKWTVRMIRLGDSPFDDFAPFESRGTGPVFEIAGVPKGEFLLCLRMLGYRPFTVKCEMPADGYAVDVGTAALEPCGVLDLEVVGADGVPVTNWDVTIQGVLPAWYQQEYAPPGRQRFSDLPVGEVEVCVGGATWKDKKFKVDLKAAQLASSRVVLEPAAP